jgi:hypothetical protein
MKGVCLAGTAVLRAGSSEAGGSPTWAGEAHSNDVKIGNRTVARRAQAQEGGGSTPGVASLLNLGLSGSCPVLLGPILPRR